MTHSKPFLITPLAPILSKPLHLNYEPLKGYAALYELVQTDPNEALKRLQNFSDPESANLKAYALLKIKKIIEAEKLIEENFLKYPENLSAKTNYADLCLRKRRRKEIGTIFPSIDLCQLYPNKTTFSASEFRGYMVFMGFYHLKLRKYKMAKQFYTLAVKADPLHPSVALLEKQLFDFIVVKAIWEFFDVHVKTRFCKKKSLI